MTKHGILQGTIIEPITFNIYANGLFHLNIDSKIISYADDTVVLVKENNSYD